MLKLENLTDEQIAYGFCKMLSRNIEVDESEVIYLAYIILDKTIQDMGGRLRQKDYTEFFKKVDENIAELEGMYSLGRDKAMLKVVQDIIYTTVATNEELWDNRDYRSSLYIKAEGVDEDIQDLFESKIFRIKDVFYNYKSSVEGVLFIGLADLSTQAVIMGEDTRITRAIYQKLISNKLMTKYCWNYLYDVIKREHRKYKKNQESLNRTLDKVEDTMLSELSDFVATLQDDELDEPSDDELRLMAGIVGIDVEDDDDDEDSDWDDDDEDTFGEDEVIRWDA